MSQWHQNDLRPMMKVYGADEKEIGHIVDTYEETFLMHKGVFFSKDRYIPYSAITSINDEKVQLSMSSDEVEQQEWEKRPDLKAHAADPIQMQYDLGHGIEDPAEEENPDRT